MNFRVKSQAYIVIVQGKSGQKVEHNIGLIHPSAAMASARRFARADDAISVRLERDGRTIAQWLKD